MEQNNAARYAVIFAADVDPSVYTEHYSTHEFEELALKLGEEIEARRQAHFVTNRDFYACAFAERAAQHFNDQPLSSLDTLIEIGQSESDAIARHA